jgi:hypothetical protein
MEFELGKLYHGIPYDEYHAQPGLRAGHLKHLMKSPRHLKAAMEEPQADTDALRFGRLVHSIMDNGEKFMDTVIVEPEFTGKTKDGKESKQSKEAKDKKKEWYSQIPKGATVVTEEEYQNVIGISASIMEHRLVRNIMKDSIREQSLWVKDPETGLTLQCRPDLIAQRGFMADWKTTRDASKDAFYQEIFKIYKRFYILGAAHYAYCSKLAGLKRPNDFTFIAIESTRPWGINIFPMDNGCLDIGERWRAHLTEQFAECMALNQWPSYKQEAVNVLPPEYPDLPDIWGLDE